MGFISDLPTQLVEAFRATLEEVAAADIILHVRDIAHPDSAAQRADVLGVLAEMAEGPDAALDAGWEDRVVEVLNKADLLGGIDARGAPRARRRAGLGADRRGAGRAAPRHRCAAVGRAGDHGGQPARPPTAPASPGSTRMARCSRARMARTAIRLTVRLSPADRARFEATRA